jgi:perosamine synthetase
MPEPQPIPMSSPDLTGAEMAAVTQVLSTRYLSIGPRLEAFERAVAEYVGAAHAVGVNSGTSGLHLAVIAAGVGDSYLNGHKPLDLVLTSPFSFVASANCILYQRAIPLFVDVDPATGNIDPVLVAEELERSHVRTFERLNVPTLQRSNVRAVLPVHAFGQPADMDPILKVARAHGLAVIEDACEAIGAEYKGRRAGTLGDAAVFAFYPNKQMTTGEGGMIVTGRRDWAELFRSLRNQGRDVFDAWLSHTRLGYNYRLDELSASLGLAQMGRIDELLAKRARVAGWYNERLAGLELVERPYIAPTTTRMSWFVYVVRILPSTGGRMPSTGGRMPSTGGRMPSANRDEVMRRLAAAGIPSRPYFTPIHLQPFYAETFGYQRGDFPVTEYLGDVSLALPFSSVMTEDQVDRVCEQLRLNVETPAPGPPWPVRQDRQAQAFQRANVSTLERSNVPAFQPSNADA